MKPLQHARITAHRYSGEWQDWIAIHDWIDSSKAIFPSMQHRMFIHSDFGEWLAVRIHKAPAGISTKPRPRTRAARYHYLMICGIAAPRCFWLKENTQRWLPIASGILQSQ